MSWVDHITNEEVLRRVNKSRERRKTSYFGHVMRGPKYQLLQLIVKGKIEGRRGIGRKQFSWLRNIRDRTGIRRAEDLVHLTFNREEYSTLVANIT